MRYHDKTVPNVVMNFRLNPEDRRLLHEFCRRNEISMSDAVRLSIRRVCGGVDKKPEQPSAA
jgi:hypothetical protein